MPKLAEKASVFSTLRFQEKIVLRRNIGSSNNLDNLVNLMSLEQVAWEACESKEGGSSHLETIVIFI